MTLLFNWRIWAAVAVAVALAASHWKTYKIGQNDVRAEWTAEKLEQAEQSAKLQVDAAKATADLQTNADNNRRSKNAQIARLNADLAAAIAGLSERPARPGAGDLPAPAAPGAATGCTGAQLYRPDAEFLARESARADRLLAELGQCQAVYDQARAALSK